MTLKVFLLRGACLVFTTGATLTTACEAQGQSVPATSAANAATQTEDIVVTAQKRPERLQNVPVAISSVTAVRLEAAQLTSTADLGIVLPGLQVQMGAGYVLPHVRGVGTTATSPSIENSVALTFDGVYIASPVASLLSLSNVSQVDLLKGPQGTLFGRNATGGVLQVTTLEPTGYFSGKASASYGNYDTFAGDLYLAGPLGSGVAADLAVHVSHQGDGYGINSFNGQDVYQTLLDLSVRSKWVVTLGDRTTIHLTGDYEETRGSAAGLNRPVDGTKLSLGASPVRDAWSINENTQPYSYVRSGGSSLRLDQSFGGVKFASISAYRKSHFFGNFPYDGTPNPGLSLNWHIYSNQLSQEFQLQSDNDSKLQWTLGGFYFRANDKYSPFKVNLDGVVAASRNLSQQIINDSVQTTSFAAFGQVTYEFLPETHLVLGARYTDERRHFLAAVAGVRPDGTAIPVLAPSQDVRIHFDEPTWRVALDHRFSPALMGYVSYNKGFKSGGFNPGAPTNPPYSPEQLDAYEAGLKADLFDRHLRFNPAFFYYRYTNIQVSTYIATSGVIYNGAGAELYGLDLDFDAVLSNRLTLNGGLEVLHSRFTSFPTAVISTPLPNGGYSQVPGSALGNELPYAPNFVGTVTGNYRLPLRDGRIDLSATLQYNDGFFTESDNKLRQSSFVTLNGAITWTLPNDRYFAKLWAKNLTGTKSVQIMFTATQGAFGQYNPPRTYGLTFGAKF